MVICLDFDGTVTTHDYPKIGKDIGAFPVLKKIIDSGHKIVLFTMRSGEELDEAVEFLKNNGIELFGINKNPTQVDWTESPKAFDNLYIDDAALGIPLTKNHFLSTRPYIDWKMVEALLISSGAIKNGS